VSRALALTPALAAVAAGVVLLLLAVDVRQYERRIPDDDAVFGIELQRDDLWRPPQIVPFGVARRLLGIGDDLAYRDALRRFGLARPRRNPLLATPGLAADRSVAAVALSRLVQREVDPARRSSELNMLGILDLVALGPSDAVRRQAALLRAISSFRDAISANDRNADAKFNLEVALRVVAETQSQTNSLRGLGGTATQSQSTGQGY
jgi:hypothetical protein